MKISKLMSLCPKQWLNPWVTQGVINFFIIDLLDFASNAKLKLNRNHTFADLAIINNVSICEVWEMTFLTNILKASSTNWDYQCPHNL